MNADVPVFNCIVYVSSAADGGVQARVANLAGLECSAANEREALGKIVRAFKARVAEHLQNKSAIPWIEPPAAAVAGEQKRYIPVHL
jgi:thiamine pyrophosphate-dependent acetolactate synthase large subunit-like protein